jgi:hypothetical protein
MSLPDFFKIPTPIIESVHLIVYALHQEAVSGSAAQQKTLVLSTDNVSERIAKGLLSQNYLHTLRRYAKTSALPVCRSVHELGTSPVGGRSALVANVTP